MRATEQTVALWLCTSCSTAIGRVIDAFFIFPVLNPYSMQGGSKQGK